MKNINKENFFKNTFGVFTKKKHPERQPDYISYKKIRIYQESMPYEGLVEFKGNTFKSLGGDYQSEDYVLIDSDVISSKYWYTYDGVYRLSNHWGNVASCYWVGKKYFKKYQKSFGL